MELDDETGGGLGRITRIAVPVLVMGALAAGIWYLLHGTGSERREAPPLPTLQATLPPPPPPPKEKPPEPEKKVVEEQKQETPQPKQMDAPKPLTINGPAQAGSDAFNLGAGDGSGMAAGGGFGAESYSRYLTSILQNAIEQDDKLNHLAFNAQVTAWVDENKRLHVRLLQSSGDPKIDDNIVAAAQQLPALDEEPPGTLQFRLAIHSRRPA
jgi:outer membrane biosynthesis protein TonB